MVRRWIAALILSFVSLPLTGPACLYAEKAESKAPIVDLVPLLAPPPAPDSPETKAELQELLEIQKHRTKEQEASAQGDAERDVFRFGDVLGDKFNEKDLPLTTALFKEAVAAGAAAVKPVKKLYDRPRPFVEDKDLKPCVQEEDTGESYPSNHATAGTVMAILLADMVPEKKAEIFARGWTFAFNRMVAGLHHRSDIVAGRIAGTVVAARLLQDPRFLKELAAAKAELRAALGYTGAKP
jgi:acid phosphatase (class A)